MPDRTLYDEVLEALEHFADLDALGDSPLNQLQLVRSLRARELSTSLLTLPSNGLAVRKLLDGAIAELEKEKPDQANLLREHFRRGRPAKEMSQARNQAPSTFYGERLKAARALADKIAEMEHDAATSVAGRRRALRFLLPQATYETLVGAEGQIAVLFRNLEESFGRPGGILTVTGIGGLGKTSLVRESLDFWLTHTDAEVQRILWAVVSQASMLDSFTLGDRQRYSRDEVLIQLGDQLEEPLHALPDTEKRLRVIRERLTSEPSVVVIDNIETDEEVAMALSVAEELARFAPILPTSRVVLNHPKVRSLRVAELLEPDALRLLRLEAERLESDPIEDLTAHAIFDLVGGNPLVLKLVAAQLGVLPVERVLAGIREQGGSMTAIYNHVYETTWNHLSPTARNILLGLLFLPLSGGTWEELREAAEAEGDTVDDRTLDGVVRELTRFNLLQVSSGLRRVYSMHRLTYRYLEEKNGLVATE